MCFILWIIFFHFLGKKSSDYIFFTFWLKKFRLNIFHFLGKKVRIIYFSKEGKNSRGMRKCDSF